MTGMGTDAIRWIPSDSEQRMDVAALREALARDTAAGDVPVAVVASAGTVSTGAVDPLIEIARVCREEDVWMHVDGAYGAFAAAVPDTPADLAGMSLADSVAVDPHKWLYSPLEAGCVLVRDPATLRAAFAYHPPYYHFGTEATNYVDLGPQNSRGFRALKVWLALRQAGRKGYAELVGRDIRLTERLFDRVEADPELEAVTCNLSIATFRYVPPDLVRDTGTPWAEDYLERLNRELLDRIQGSGEAFVSNAVVDGRYVLRTCIVNINTRESDVDALPGIITRMGRQVDAGLRSQLDERGIARVATA
jgi:aromatic-L-amino-acid decarboxylase